MHYDRLISHPSSFISYWRNSPFKKMHRQNRMNEPNCGSSIKSTLFWIVTPCSSVEILRAVWRNLLLPSSGSKSKPSKKLLSSSACRLIPSGFLLHLLFNVGSNFFRNVAYRNTREYVSEDDTITVAWTSNPVQIKLFSNFLIRML
jgi:hypothetical protein